MRAQVQAEPLVVVLEEAGVQLLPARFPLGSWRMLQVGQQKATEQMRQLLGVLEGLKLDHNVILEPHSRSCQGSGLQQV